jgi:hypothetical protein
VTAAKLTPEIITGVNALLWDYAQADEQDRFLIAYTLDSRDPAAWITAVLKSRGITPELVPMRPLVDPKFEERLHAALPDPDHLRGKLIIFTLERDTMSHFRPLLETLARFGAYKCKVIRIISAAAEFFTQSLNLTPEVLSARNASLLDRLDGSKSMMVRSAGGTDLRITVDSSRYDWISNRGAWRPGGFLILPAGEIATYPAQIDGVLVADGAINCNFISDLNMMLGNHPITVEIENGKAVDFSCPDDEIAEFIRTGFAMKFGQNVGELGFGTNSGIDRFIPQNSHVNERHPGVHIGFGQHNQNHARVPYVADIHMDLITNGATIAIDGDPDVIDLDNLVVSGVSHPQSVRDEDIVGDCCGFNYVDVLGDMMSAEACGAGAGPE